MIIEMIRYLKILSVFLLMGSLIHCKDNKGGTVTMDSKDKIDGSVSSGEPVSVLIERPQDVKTPKGMVWIPGGEFMQGAVAHDTMAMNHEKPAHKVWLDGFFMDITEVTNAQFAKFVQETGYITLGERAVDWEEMKHQLPEGTPKPHDSILQPGSLTFKKTRT